MSVNPQIPSRKCSNQWVRICPKVQLVNPKTTVMMAYMRIANFATLQSTQEHITSATGGKSLHVSWVYTCASAYVGLHLMFLSVWSMPWLAWCTVAYSVSVLPGKCLLPTVTHLPVPEQDISRQAWTSEPNIQCLYSVCCAGLYTQKWSFRSFAAP